MARPSLQRSCAVVGNQRVSVSHGQFHVVHGSSPRLHGRSEQEMGVSCELFASPLLGAQLVLTLAWWARG